VLIESYGNITGPRAARLYTALSVRGLRSQPPEVLSSSTSTSSTPSRADTFANKVMAVLSILIEPSLHANLRGDLLKLAASASSVWDVAQCDKRQFITYPTLDPEDLEDLEDFGGCPDDISPPNNEIIVKFPRIIAQSCPRGAGARPAGPPGGWVESEPEPYIQETLIQRGMGLPKWSSLVMDGEEEEEDMRLDKERKEREEEKRRADESLKELEKASTRTKRRSLQSKRDSIAESRSSLSPQ